MLPTLILQQIVCLKGCLTWPLVKLGTGDAHNVHLLGLTVGFISCFTRTWRLLAFLQFFFVRWSADAHVIKDRFIEDRFGRQRASRQNIDNKLRTLERPFFVVSCFRTGGSCGLCFWSQYTMIS